MYIYTGAINIGFVFLYSSMFAQIKYCWLNNLYKNARAAPYMIYKIINICIQFLSRWKKYFFQFFICLLPKIFVEIKFIIFSFFFLIVKKANCSLAVGEIDRYKLFRTYISVYLFFLILCFFFQKLTWVDGSGNSITHGIEYISQPMSDIKRSSVRSILKLSPQRHHHNTTFSCQSHNQADRNFKIAEIKLEVNFLKIYF